MRYDKPKGQRIKRFFFGVNVENYWWCPEINHWVSNNIMKEYPQFSYASTARCGTVRAFRRMLRKHPNIKRRATLVSKYAGHDVYA